MSNICIMKYCCSFQYSNICLKLYLDCEISDLNEADFYILFDLQTMHYLLIILDT